MDHMTVKGKFNLSGWLKSSVRKDMQVGAQSARLYGGIIPEPVNALLTTDYKLHGTKK